MVKLDPASLKTPNTITIGTPPKTMTLSRVQPITSLNNKQQAFVLNKLSNRAIKLQVPGLGSQQAKAPAKILPAPQTTVSTAKLGTQRVLVKQAGGTHTVLPTGQLIEVSSAQQLAAATQLHSLNGVRH